MKAVYVIDECTEERKVFIQDLTKKNQGWILCSERLPESKNDVLVWKDNMYSVAWYQEVTKQWRSNDFPADESKDVIAWQPLPEPYKPEFN